MAHHGNSIVHRGLTASWRRRRVLTPVSDLSWTPHLHSCDTQCHLHKVGVFHMHTCRTM